METPLPFKCPKCKAESGEITSTETTSFYMYALWECANCGQQYEVTYKPVHKEKL